MPKKYTSQAFDDLLCKQDQPWIKDAACRNMPKRLFFSATKDDPNIQTAKFVCRGCSVMDECLKYALASPWMSGVFGGTDESERRKLLKGRHVA